MGHKEMEENIYQWCKQAQDKSSVLEEQKKYVWTRVKANKKMVTALAEYACNVLCNKMLYNRRNLNKRNIIDFCASFDGTEFKPLEGYGHSVTKRTFATMCEVRASLMETFICGDKPIGQATRDYLLDWASIHKDKSQSDAIRACIYEAVAKKTAANKIVAECMTSEQLGTLIGNVTRAYRRKHA